MQLLAIDGAVHTIDANGTWGDLSDKARLALAEIPGFDMPMLPAQAERPYTAP